MPRATNGATQARERAERAWPVATWQATPVAGLIPVSRIDVPPDTPEPGEDLIASVRTLGVHTPVIVSATPTGFAIIAGARRVLAARAAGLEFINAMTYLSASAPVRAASIALTENLVRRPNILREIEAVETLAQSMGPEQMQQELGVTRRHLAERLLLSRLAPPLRQALADGRMTPSVAMLAARGDPEQQEAVETLLFIRRGAERLRDRRVLAAEVRGILRGDAPESLQDAPGATNEWPGMVPGAVPDTVAQVCTQWTLLDDGRRWNHWAENSLPEGNPEFFVVSRMPIQDEYVGLAHVGGEVERFYPESWMREQIAASRAALEVIDEDHIRFQGTPYVNVHLARDVMNTVPRADHEAQLRALHEQLAQHAAEVRATPEGSTEAEEESWAFVHRMLCRIERVMPVAPNGESDAAYHAMEDLRAMAHRLAEAEVRDGRPGNLEDMVVTPGGWSADEMEMFRASVTVELSEQDPTPVRRRGGPVTVQPNAQPAFTVTATPAVNTLNVTMVPPRQRREVRPESLLVNGHREFDRQPGAIGRTFRRYVDGGRIRRRYLSEHEWNTQLNLELERARRGER